MQAATTIGPNESIMLTTLSMSDSPGEAAFSTGNSVFEFSESGSLSSTCSICCDPFAARCPSQFHPHSYEQIHWFFFAHHCRVDKCKSSQRDPSEHSNRFCAHKTTRNSCISRDPSMGTSKRWVTQQARVRLSELLRLPIDDLVHRSARYQGCRSIAD